MGPHDRGRFDHGWTKCPNCEGAPVKTTVALTLMELVESIERLEAELADLRASSVVVRRKCERCGGDGWGEGQRHIAGNECPDCDNGWQLAEGVEEKGYGDIVTNDGFFIPARLIEGDDAGG